MECYGDEQIDGDDRIKEVQSRSLDGGCWDAVVVDSMERDKQGRDKEARQSADMER